MREKHVYFSQNKTNRILVFDKSVQIWTSGYFVRRVNTLTWLLACNQSMSNFQGVQAWLMFIRFYHDFDGGGGFFALHARTNS